MTQSRVDPSRGDQRHNLLARALLLIGGVAAIAWAVYAHGGGVMAWAVEQQRVFQNEIAHAVRALRDGNILALGTLLGASFIYGFAHAVGPGHGKMLIAGAATASRKTAWRMAGVGFLASLTQALSAILLAYGALGLFSLSGRAATGLAANWLAPLSALAVAMVGLWLVWRGVRGLQAARREVSSCGHGCSGGCRHAPTPAETEAAQGWFETLSLVLSIGVRPCSGALIVLAICWNFGLYAAGALSALAMAVGTGLVVSGAALIASGFRDAQALRGSDQGSRMLLAWVQISAGLAVALLSGLVAAGGFGA